MSFIVFVILPSIPQIRGILAAPLVATDNDAHGDACYVLAAGRAFTERLDAASDLYHLKRVPLIFIMENNDKGVWDFVSRRNWIQTELAISRLVWKGVPRDCIITVPEVKGAMGTLREAANMAKWLPEHHVNRLVIVSSAPHLRRSMLAFEKVLPASIAVSPYAATSFETSAELMEPIWKEYLKLLSYKVYLSFRKTI
jgi:hypothetical protein